MEVFYSLVLMSVLWIVAGWCKGRADAIQHDPYYRDKEWKRKWKLNGDFPVSYLNTKNPHWWYAGIYHTNGYVVERFPFSSTILVFLTDKWHLMNFVQYRIYDGAATGLVYAVVIHKWWVWASMPLLLPLFRYFGFGPGYKRP